MFVYYYVHLNLPFTTVERRLLVVLDDLSRMGSAAYREGEALRTSLGIAGDTRRIGAKKIEIVVGDPMRRENETDVPILWRATGTPGLFPAMEAGLVVATLGPDLTQLALRGSYDLPLGVVGSALDRTLFHRVAEASVKGLVDRIARSIEREGPLKRAG